MLGGYFIKLGQRFSVSRGMIPEPYVDALKPLCADVPPRRFEAMASVFLAATKKTPTEAFESIDAHPLGSASLAQTHRAILRLGTIFENTREVVVKIQYPEVDETFVLDLDNVLLISKIMAPESFYSNFKREYETHLDELDFRKEANSLIRVSRSMVRAGLAPQKIVIPQPLLELTTHKTLVMEYLPGMSFQSIIKHNVDIFARSLGLRDADELRERFNEKIQLKQIGKTTKTQTSPINQDANAISRAKLVSKIMTGATNCGIAAHNSSVLALRWIGARNSLELCAYKKPPAQELERILNLVIVAHGYQLLIDGYVNIDPHPGNILVLPDGRVGLIDYGQCVAFTTEERSGFARIIQALHSGDKLKVVAGMRILPPCGYEVKNDCWQAVFSYAQSYFDKFDMTPLPYDDGSLPSSDLVERLDKHSEIFVPRCVAFVRRLTFILLCMGMEFGVQSSLAASWKSLAEQVIDKEAKKEGDLATSDSGVNDANTSAVHLKLIERVSDRICPWSTTALKCC